MRELPGVITAVDGVDGLSVLRLTGELDVEAQSDMSQQVERALAGTSTTLVVDLTSVDFLGSSGLSVLIEARGRAEQLDVTLLLVAARRATLLPLELTGLSERFPVYPTVESAVSARLR